MKLSKKTAYEAWMNIVKKIGTVQGYIIFGILYFIIFGLYSLFFRLYVVIKKTSKQQNLKDTFWIDEKEDTLSVESQVRHQF